MFIYVKRIYTMEEQYGKYVGIEAIVFLLSNLYGGSMNLYFSNGGADTVASYANGGQSGIWCLIMIPYFIFTEFAPTLAYALTSYKFA